MSSLSLSVLKLSETHNKRILFSPLNWGMGHVSRSLAFINQLLLQNNKIYIACNKQQREIYTEYLDGVKYIEHTGYPFDFKGKGQFGLDLLIGFPDLQMRLDKERKEVVEYCSLYDIDLIVSDHRYGFRSDDIQSVFVTHQANLPTKWYQIAANAIHQKWMNKFDCIWIMDYSDNRLAGKLSQYVGSKMVDYIGPFSRFANYSDNVIKDIELVLIASGPEIYAQQLIENNANLAENLYVICSPNLEVPSGVTRVSGNWKERDAIIRRSKKIISRSGYSTIMDLEHLDAEFELIHTPGQEEQKYLESLHAAF